MSSSNELYSLLDEFNSDLESENELNTQNSVCEIKVLIQKRNPIPNNANLWKGFLSTKNADFEFLCAIAKKLLFQRPFIALKLKESESLLLLLWDVDGCSTFSPQKSHCERVINQLKLEGFQIAFSMSRLFQPQAYLERVVKQSELIQKCNIEFAFYRECDFVQFTAISTFLEKKFSYSPLL